MASGFWYLKDGRGFGKRIQIMIRMLEEINSELKLDKETKEFSNYLNKFIPTEKHELNGYGGFYNTETGENIMMVIDFREFTKENQQRFWEATQRATRKLIKKEDKNDDGLISLFKILSDMNKRASKGEDPMKLNDMGTIEPDSGEKKGPGWT